MKCEEATRRRMTEEGVVAIESPEMAEAGKPEPVEETTPTDYFLKCLEGRFEKQVMWNGTFCENKFLDEGRLVVYVAINFEMGRMKIISQKHVVPKIVKLESVEQAEKLIREIL
jgi:hypothetical protein